MDTNTKTKTNRRWTQIYADGFSKDVLGLRSIWQLPDYINFTALRLH